MARIARLGVVLGKQCVKIKLFSQVATIIVVVFRAWHGIGEHTKKGRGQLAELGFFSLVVVGSILCLQQVRSQSSNQQA